MNTIVFGSPEARMIREKDRLLERAELEVDQKLAELPGDTRQEKLVSLAARIQAINEEIREHMQIVTLLEDDLVPLRALQREARKLMP